MFLIKLIICFLFFNTNSYGLGGQLLEEANATTGAAQVDYFYVNGRPIAEYNNSTGAMSYLQADRLGTPQKASNSAKAITWAANYQPFGTTAAVTSTITQNLRFPGQYADSETGLYHNGFRDYLPGVGRYVQSDLAGFMGGMNTYGYALQNPLRGIDP